MKSKKLTTLQFITKRARLQNSKYSILIYGERSNSDKERKAKARNKAVLLVTKEKKFIISSVGCLLLHLSLKKKKAH